MKVVFQIIDLSLIGALVWFTFKHFGRTGEMEMFLLCLSAASYRAHRFVEELYG